MFFALLSVGLQAAAMVQQQKQVELSKKQSTVRARQERLQMIRQQQLQQAQARAYAASAGALKTSAIQGGLSSLSSQVGSQLGYATQMSGLSGQITDASSREAMFGTLSGISAGLSNVDWGTNKKYPDILPKGY